jgi:hypothetical protein
MKIYEIIFERIVDPVKLAQRVANRYGRRTRYGNWEAPVRGQHIPLRSFNSREADAVYRAYTRVRYRLRSRVDSGLSLADQDRESSRLFGDLFRPDRMDIRGLRATQPFVRVDDPGLLAAKLGEMSPTIRVATYRGRDYIVDGHHAVVAASMRGERQIMVLHIDLDNLI